MLSALLLCGVLAAPSTIVQPLQDAPPAAKADKKEGKTLEQLERSARAAARKVELAHLEAEIAKEKNREEHARARGALEDKARGLELAKRELDVYNAFDAPAAIEAAQLSVDRAESRLVSEQQDLEGILRIYAEEEEAPAKQEIIRRHEVSVAFAERAVAAAAKGLEKAGADVQLAIDKKRHAIEKAERELRMAERAMDRTELTVKLAQMKAEDAILSAKEALADAEKALHERQEKAEGEDQ